MRNATIYAKLKKIYEDKTSGASILAGKLFSVLKEKARETERKDDFLYFLKALKRDLKKHHPLLFQLQNLVDIILTLARESTKKEIKVEAMKLSDGLKPSPLTTISEGICI